MTEIEALNKAIGSATELVKEYKLENKRLKALCGALCALLIVEAVR